MPNCAQCSNGFEITPEDLAFYEKVSPVFNGKKELIPPPTLCPDCRMQRRLTWRNEKKLYHRKCDMTGKQIISIYSPETPYKVYDHREWYSDKWNPLDYGREYDFNRPFFDQMKDLLRVVPMRSVNLQAENENCEYTNLTTRNKDCYLIFAANDNQDCYYCMYMHRSKNLVDSFFTFDSEWCYECIDCYHCYRLEHSQFCENCSESMMLFSCKSCSNCIGCVNLVQKQYHILNKPCSKEEFETAKAQIKTDPKIRAEFLAQFEALRLSQPHKFYAGISNENVSGDHLSYSKNTHHSFDCTYLEDCKYCTWLHKAKECWDCYAWGIPGELGYESHLIGNGFYNVRFSESCWNNISDLLYSRYCLDGSNHLFGCVCLIRKEYCILNKQYSEEEYNALVPKIIEHMKSTGEWGEFFPAELSPYGYNETVAQEYFPLSEEKIRTQGWNWREEDEQTKKYLGPSPAIPDTINDVPDDITNAILTCEVTGRPYKIIPQELAFYREMNIPLPRRCFDQRHADRRAKRNPRKLWDRECASCKKSIQTTYSPDRPEIVYCEECYLKEVY
jgi:hypothetical protein